MIESNSDKRNEWIKQLEERKGAGVAPVMESPENSQGSFDLSSASGVISSEEGGATQVFSSAVHIVELAPSAEVSDTVMETTIRNEISVPTPDQPIPVRGSARIQDGGGVKTTVL